MEAKLIRVINARQHNLRSVSLDIPREKLVVFTGLSGSGKSSLAFDTIHAEGQRRYVESLSVHARLFLEQIGKPDVDAIDGLPPTLAIEQRASAVNPRSTVATTTEIYDFLRVLYARVGSPHCPQCGQPLPRLTADQMVDAVLSSAEEARAIILAPLGRGLSAGGDAKAVLRRMQREGFVRARINGEIVELAELGELPASKKLDLDVVVDRIVIRPDARRRLAEAIELALSLAEGTVIVSRAARDGAWSDTVYSERHACSACGIRLEELSPRIFSFNSPYGACQTCGGLGSVQSFDPELIFPDPDQPLATAIAPWQGAGKRASALYGKLLKSLCEAFRIKPTTPFKDAPEDLRRILLEGSQPRDKRERNIEFEGVLPNLERRNKSAGSSGLSRLAAFQTDRVCSACNGARLRPEALAVRVGGKSIHEVAQLSIVSAIGFFSGLPLAGDQEQIAAPLLREVLARLRFMQEVGLHYLTLDRGSATLSGGEAQRIRLATQLGSGLVGVCYVLDEPTIGLHQRDNERLLRSIRRLVDLGNSVLVVEHDEDVIRAADHLVDIGPGAGLHGGRIIASGPAEQVLASPASITGRYLRDEYAIQLPDERRVARRGDWIQVIGASENNLKKIDVSIPLGVLCAVTGVSGSGKSTLVTQTLLPALRRRLGQGRERVGAHERLVGVSKIEKVIEVDQTPIGRTPRSNPATYTGVFDEIRRLYARTKEARIRGYDNSRFSFNAKGGRCEACQGQGTRRIEMHFLPDVFVECAECKGTRYNRETLEVRYRGKSIADVLAMRVEEVIPFFDSFSKIKAGLQTLADVGLSYIQIGQPSNTLSGGEAQRVKLAAELGKPSLGHTLYVLDEPTTGLHFADIDTLLAVLSRLVGMNNTVLVIEHNLDVIKTADWIIDLGPEGGAEGGQVVVAGPPETVAACDASHTGRYLRSKLPALTARSA